MQHWLQFWFGALPDSFRARFFSQTFVLRSSVTNSRLVILRDFKIWVL
jgi:hypothetical protein